MKPALRSLVVLICLLLSGCALWSPWQDEPIEVATADGPAEWLVVTYADLDRSPSDVMDMLLETELAADEKLAATDAGMIDGNEIGESEYQLFFVGDDRHRMWELLEPVLAEAPVPWSRVELFVTLDGEPEVILPR